MKKIWLLLILIILILFFAPGTMVPKTKLDSSANEQCKMLTPIGGCFNSCLGLTKEVCEETNGCYSRCEQTCYGIISGTCTDNIIKNKVDYWK